MKNLLLTISLLAVAFTLGCQSSKQNTANHVDGDAAETTREYNFGEKTSFVMEMRAQLIELNKGLDELSLKIDKSSEPVQGDAKLKLDMLREQVKRLDKQLDEDSNATLSTWNVMKTDTEAHFAELKTGMEQLSQTVSTTNTP